jgi:ubiquinone/menaquinone biosynthesis C-methylase UbiE
MQRPDWYLDELAHAGGEHLDPAYVQTYDAKAGTDPMPDVERLRALGLNDESVLVDLGAGTGDFAVTVASFCRRVVAVDVSTVMLEMIRKKAGELNLTNVELVHAGFLSYDHTGDLADFVYTRHALHHLPDFWKAIALQRIAGMLRPGGVLHLRDLFFNFGLDEAGDIIESWLGGAPTRPEEGWTRAQLAEHLRDEYSTFSWLLEPMLERAGFDIQEVHANPRGTHMEFTCVKR